MLLTEASAAQMGVPLDLSAPTAIPPGPDGFRAEWSFDAETIEGTVEAEPGLKLLGLGAGDHHGARRQGSQREVTLRRPAGLAFNPPATRIDESPCPAAVDAVASAVAETRARSGPRGISLTPGPKRVGPPLPVCR